VLGNWIKVILKRTDWHGSFLSDGKKRSTKRGPCMKNFQTCFMMLTLHAVRKESIPGRSCRSIVHMHVLTREPVRCDLLHSNNVMETQRCVVGVHLINRVTNSNHSKQSYVE
jgi:hypothetical protein